MYSKRALAQVARAAGQLKLRQHSTGGKPKLLGISKRGNPYLRRLFIHGARSIFTQAHRDRLALNAWMSELEHRMHRNIAIVAVANKLARITWAVLAKGTNYHWPGTDQLEPREPG